MSQLGLSENKKIDKRIANIHKFASCQTSKMIFEQWEKIETNPCRIHYKTVGIFTNSIEESTMKLLLLLLVAGLVLSVEARAKGP